MSGTDTQFIVIGGGMTGLACAHRLAALGVEALLLESDDRAGGKVRTICEDGYQFEAGPNTLIANRRAMLDLIVEAGLEREIVDGSPSARKRWITLNGRMCALPSGPVAALRSPLLGPGALARALGDLVIGGAGAAPEDESVASFITRRFGATVLRHAVAPFLSGVYAGDAERLEAASVLPTLVAAEKSRGSVIRGLIAERRRARRAGEERLPMRSITLRRGLESLSQSVAAALGDRLRLNCPVERLTLEGGRMKVWTEGGTWLTCRHAVIAGGGPAGGLLAGLEGGDALAARLRAVPHAGLAMVGLAYERGAIDHPLDGFGYLNGPGAPGPALGCLFRSSVFPHAAPAGRALLVVFIGGMRFPGCAEKTSAELCGIARAELERVLKVTRDPERTFVHRWRSAVPQYERGHARLAGDVRAWCEARPVSLAGCLLTGVSLNDCVSAGRAEAERLARTTGGGAASKEAHLCASA